VLFGDAGAAWQGSGHHLRAGASIRVDRQSFEPQARARRAVIPSVERTMRLERRFEGLENGRQVAAARRQYLIGDLAKPPGSSLGVDLGDQALVVDLDVAEKLKAESQQAVR
jgi:hypothetical protein